MLKLIGLYVMAVAYIAAGLNHFRAPGFYLKMMPPYLPAHGFLVAASGVAEVLLGVLLLPAITRPYAAWGVIALLIAIFPANLYMLTARETVFPDFPVWALWLRLPLQLVLIWWAWIYTRPVGIP
jgi:uncharacterized membrane protein